MKFVFSVNRDNAVDYDGVITQPSAGYYTNIRVTYIVEAVTGITNNVELFFGTNVPTLTSLTEISTGTISPMPEYDRNGIHFFIVPSDVTPEAGTDNPRGVTKYFGGRRIWVDHDDILRMVVKDFESTDCVMMVEADFVPHVGSLFQQIKVGGIQEPDAITWFGTQLNYYVAPISLRNVVVKMNMDFITTSGVGNLLVKKFEGYKDFTPTTSGTDPSATNSFGDILKDDLTAGDTLSHQFNAVIPLAGDLTARSSATVPIGNLNKGEIIAWQYDTVTAGTSDTLSITANIQGVVAHRTRLSRGDFFNSNVIEDLNKNQMSVGGMLS